jgi:5-formyltetrahydrofolate cyclo-ligase
MRGEEAVKAERRALRQRLIARRLAISGEERRRWSAAIEQKLLALLLSLPGKIIGLYAPVRGEFDPLPLAPALIAAGRRLALPAVVEPRAALEYRRWEPGAALAPGRHGIPAPKTREAVLPEILIVPLLGFNDRKFRLGYGGGYFDRTIAKLSPPPVTIGVGFEIAHLAGFVPQPHDVALDYILTEARG